LSLLGMRERGQPAQQCQYCQGLNESKE
jgi:hypothetical protein